MPTTISYDRYTEQEQDLLRHEWRRGTATKRIARMLDRSPSSVMGQRRRLGLPSRINPKTATVVRSVSLPSDLNNIAVARASTLGISFNRHIRNLIEQDLDAHP
jgi:hypothetical protein